MSDYAKAASDFKARLELKAKKKTDLDAFFEAVKSSIVAEAKKANAELAIVNAPTVDFQEASLGEPTIELRCASAICRIAQDREVPSIAAIVTSETGEESVTFLVLTDETPLKAHRVSLVPAIEEKVGPSEIAATIVEELINGAP